VIQKDNVCWPSVEEACMDRIDALHVDLETAPADRVPRLQGEARSHDEEKLERVTQEIIGAFERVASEHRADAGQEGLPSQESRVARSNFKTRIPENHRLVTLARQAAHQQAARRAA
jgi:hypothetical protein